MLSNFLFFMMLDLGIDIFRGTVLRFLPSDERKLMKMSWAVKKWGLILNTYVR